jgi:phosphoglycolate phosphatase-like HAD superfamily hydrolase
MNKHNISSPSQVIKVGDTIADILEGKNAGCHTVSVLSGSCKRSVLEKHVPNYILNDIMDLKIN